MTDQSVDRRPVALVTGANKGIGFAVARGLGQRGFTVLVGSRDRSRGDAAVAALVNEGLDARLVMMSVDDDDSVRRASDVVGRDFGRLDALVNNAAIKLEAAPSPPSQCSLQLVQQTFDTNVFGTIRVTQALLPLMRQAPAPRIVNLSSGLGSLTLAVTDPLYMARPLLSYCVSKAAINSITVQFANELRDSAFKVNAADPGFTNTDMIRTAARTTGRTAEDASALIVHLATLGPDGPTGGFFNDDGPVPW